MTERKIQPAKWAYVVGFFYGSTTAGFLVAASSIDWLPMWAATLVFTAIAAHAYFIVAPKWGRL